MTFEDHCFCHRFFKFSAQPFLTPYRAIVGIWLRMSISLKFLQSNRAAMDPSCWALHFCRAPTDLFMAHVPSSSIGNEFKVNYLWIVVENLPSGACESGCFIESIPSCSPWICVCQSSAFVDLNKKERSICYKSKMEPLRE